MSVDPENRAGLSAATLEEIDRCCLDFERQWQSGNAPSLQEFLVDCSGADRQILFAELLVLDLDYRHRLGENVESQDYVVQFPTDADTIGRVFKTQFDQNCFPDTSSPYQTQAKFRIPKTVADFPDRIGRYRISEVLGTGGFATVCKAHDDDLNRDVAIKIPHANLLYKIGGNDLFLTEARTLATLTHPSIAAVYDMGQLENGQDVYIVSQFIDNGDLSARMKEGELSMQESIGIVITMAKALHYAHAQGFVHRDVKPSNILLDSNGKSYLADFGLALNNVDVGHKELEFAGTRAYMSPEQIRGEGHLVDGRADVYGLGVVLYELLTGVKPFSSDTIERLVEQVRSRPPKPLRQIDDQIPGAVENVCLKALAKSPTERYSTALDMAIDLENALKPKISSASWLVKRKAMLIAVMLLTVLVATVSWAYIKISSGNGGGVVAAPAVEAKIGSIAVLPFKPLQMKPEKNYLGLSLADAVITRLSNLTQINVRPTGSVRHYVARDVDPLEAGKAMKVDAIIDASIQQIEETIRVTVRIVRTADGKSLWAGTFEEGPLNAFRLQDAIVEKITSAISVNLDQNQKSRIKHRHVPHPDAFDAYLQGRYYWHQRSRVSLDIAIEFFEKSINLDPLFPLAHVGLAECYALFDYYNYYEIDNVMPLARASAQEAVRLDDQLTDAHRVLAFVTFSYGWNWKRAEEMYLQAVELNPNDATARQWYGELLMYMQRFDESIVQLEKAAELNPLSEIIYSMRGSPYLWARNVGQARTHFNEALQIYPRSVIAKFGLAYCHELEGEYELALEIFQKFTSPKRLSTAATIGEVYCLAKLNRKVEALEVLRQHIELPDNKRFTPYGLAVMCVALGDKDQAFEWLKLAVADRDDLMMMLNVDHHLDDLRDDPRFESLMIKIGLGPIR